MKAEVVALVLVPGEAEVVMRAVSELVEREGPSADALAVLEMMEGAVEPATLDAFEEWLS